MKKLFLIAALAAASLTGSASAEPFRSDTGVATIRTAGIDLRSEAGVRTLDRRILHAASELCGTPSPSDALGRKRFDACFNEARETAVAQRTHAIATARREDGAIVAASR